MKRGTRRTPSTRRRTPIPEEPEPFTPVSVPASKKKEPAKKRAASKSKKTKGGGDDPWQEKQQRKKKKLGDATEHKIKCSGVKKQLFKGVSDALKTKNAGGSNGIVIEFVQEHADKDIMSANDGRLLYKKGDFTADKVIVRGHKDLVNPIYKWMQNEQNVAGPNGRPKLREERYVNWWCAGDDTLIVAWLLSSGRSIFVYKGTRQGELVIGYRVKCLQQVKEFGEFCEEAVNGTNQWENMTNALNMATINIDARVKATVDLYPDVLLDGATDKVALFAGDMWLFTKEVRVLRA